MSKLILGDCVEILRTMEDNSIDSIVTDPPYELGFMNKEWDATGIANRVDLWIECLRVLKPGGHLLAFSGTRTYHRMTCAIEDAGFEIRDQLGWMYGNGFPKSHDVSKAIDKAAGAIRTEVIGVKPGHEGFENRGNMSSVQSFKGTMGGDGGFSRPWMEDPEKVERYHQKFAPITDVAKKWQGWGTALKPAWEPICLARKPVAGTVAENVLRHGTGAINIDECRVEHVTIEGGNLAINPHLRKSINGGNGGNIFPTEKNRRVVTPNQSGRWPANVIHDGSEEVLATFPESKGAIGNVKISDKIKTHINCYGNYGPRPPQKIRGDNGSAARFFYCAKVSKKERGEGNNHPTVKPIALMQYLCRLVTPPKGIVLDPFMGSGSTGIAALNEGFKFIGIEKEQEYFKIAEIRIKKHKSNNLKGLFK